MIKVKLKNIPVRISSGNCIDGKYLGIDLQTWKTINNGNEVEVIEIPKEAEEYLVSVEKKESKKQKTKTRGDK